MYNVKHRMSSNIHMHIFFYYPVMKLSHDVYSTLPRTYIVASRSPVMAVDTCQGSLPDPLSRPFVFIACMLITGGDLVPVESWVRGGRFVGFGGPGASVLVSPFLSLSPLPPGLGGGGGGGGERERERERDQDNTRRRRACCFVLSGKGVYWYLFSNHSTLSVLR